jgi:hypothetical protein
MNHRLDQRLLVFRSKFLIFCGNESFEVLHNGSMFCHVRGQDIFNYVLPDFRLLSRF